MRPYIAVSVILIVATIVASAVAYPSLPDSIKSHWNAKGEADGYMSKGLALSIVPALSVLMFILFVAIPMIDPLKKNIEKFRKHYEGMVVVILVFMLYMHLLTIAANTTLLLNMTIMIMPAMALLMYYMGIVLDNAKQNWFVGIRTPWTLSSRKVWDLTHKRGAKMFKALAVLALAGILMGEWGVFVFIAVVLVAAFYLVLYSYLVYRKENK